MNTIVFFFLLHHSVQGFTSTTFTTNSLIRPKVTVVQDPCTHRYTQCVSLKQSLSLLYMAKESRSSSGKGFGKESAAASATPKPKPNTDPSNDSAVAPIMVDEDQVEEPLSGGKKALARLRRQAAEQRNDELRSVRELQRIDSSLQEDPSAAVIPEKVAQRMGKRMIPFVGVPLFGVLGTFVAFWYFTVYGELELQPTIVAYSTIAVLGFGLFGITYSVMSASWDPEEEGSSLGVDEFKTNLDNIKEGLQRSRQNAMLRDRMRDMDE